MSVDWAAMVRDPVYQREGLIVEATELIAGTIATAILESLNAATKIDDQ